MIMGPMPEKCIRMTSMLHRHCPVYIIIRSEEKHHRLASDQNALGLMSWLMIVFVFTR